VPGAAAAYSLRSLSRSYAGPVVTVRRSSDDAEDSFTAGEVVDGTLAAFCGAGDGFVYQWWDQSGNGNHAVAPADSNEPQIVDSGVVITEEGKPAIEWPLGASGLQLVISSAVPAASTIFVATALSTGITPFISNTVASGSGYISFDPEEIRYRTPTPANYDYNIGSANNQRIVSAFINNLLSQSVFSNGAVSPDSPQTIEAIASLSHIGYRPISNWTFEGYFQEVILYESDVSSQRELIEGNIAWSYS
jgi:hypothetical protein